MTTGSVVARVYTSDAEIPLDNAAVSITKKTGKTKKELLAFRLTDMDGLTEAFPVVTPDLAESQNNLPGSAPFETVDIMVEQVGYDRILAENVQVFPAVETRQDFSMVPTAELPDRYDKTAVFNITAQNL